MRAQNPFLCIDWRLSQQEIEDRVSRFDLKLVIRDFEAQISLENGVLRDDAWQDAIEQSSAGFPVPRLEDEATALFAASSGTTGVPEVVRVTHGALVARSVGDNWLTHSPNAGDCVLRALPTSFTLGRGFNFSYLCTGCPSVLMPSIYSPQDYVDTIDRYGITHANANPTILHWLIENAPETGYLLPDMKMLGCTGATLSPENKKAIMSHVTPNLFEKYGSVATGIITVARPEDIRANPGSVGRSAFSVELEIAGEDGQTLPPGTPGAIRCRSPQAAVPYLVDSQTRADGNWRDGFWYTDDHGMLDEDNCLYLLGRSASLIIRAGVNIYAEEVEEALRSHPDVADVAVLGQASEALGAEPVALVISNRKDTDAAQDLIAFCQSKISRYKVPVAVHFVDDLPRSSANKINRSALPDMLNRLQKQN